MTKQEYYEHLCKIGFPELLAATMANQSDKHSRAVATTSMVEEIYSFELWDCTKEGFNFWSSIIDCLK